MNGTIFTLRNLYRDGTICLEKAGIADAKLDAWYLLEYETKISRAMFLADPDKEVEKDKAEHYRKDIETRAQRIAQRIFHCSILLVNRNSWGWISR